MAEDEKETLVFGAKCTYCRSSLPGLKKGNSPICSDEACTSRHQKETEEIGALIRLYLDKAMQKKIESLLMERRDADVIALVKTVPDEQRGPYRALWKKYHA